MPARGEDRRPAVYKAIRDLLGRPGLARVVPRSPLESCAALGSCHPTGHPSEYGQSTKPGGVGRDDDFAAQGADIDLCAVLPGEDT